MKKTWQWVVEYHMPIERLVDYDDDYAQEKVNEFLAWDKRVPRPAHLEFYRQYVEWVPLSEGVFQMLIYPSTRDILPGDMKPKHLNDCLQAMKVMFEKNRHADPYSMRNTTRIDELRYTYRNNLFRLFNVRTKEVIPMDIFG